MSAKIKSVPGLLSLSILFFVFSINIIAQTEESAKNQGENEKYKQTAAELTQSLSQKVSLKPEQSKEVTEALINYQKSINEASAGTSESDMEKKISAINENLKSEITNVLDDSQKTAFNEINDQWFQEVKNKTHSATVKSETKDKNY